MPTPALQSSLCDSSNYNNHTTVLQTIQNISKFLHAAVDALNLETSSQIRKRGIGEESENELSVPLTPNFCEAFDTKFEYCSQSSGAIMHYGISHCF